MVEGAWFNSMTSDSKIKFVLIFLVISICIQILIKYIQKGVDAMGKVIGSILEVLQSFAISLVAGATLSLR